MTFEQPPGLEMNWWNRVYFYSSLYDFDSLGSASMRTPTQKFILQGKSAIIRLLDLHYFSKDDAELCSSLITRINPRTMNAAAVALAFTTYDEHTKKFLLEPDPQSKGKMKEYQLRKCFKTLAKKLQNNDSDLDKFQKDYGITAPDLLRYFFFLRDGKPLDSNLSSTAEEEQW